MPVKFSAVCAQLILGRSTLSQNASVPIPARAVHLLPVVVKFRFALRGTA
jgi:hypothetical protein